MSEFEELTDYELWERLPQAGPSERVDVLLTLATRSFDQHEFARAAELAGQAATEAKAAEVSTLAEECHYLEGRARVQAGDRDAALVAFQAGVDAYAAPNPSPGLARNYWGLADSLYHSSRFIDAASAAQRSVEAATADEDLQLAGLSALLQARALFYGDREEDALDHCASARGYYQSVPAPFGVNDCDDFAARVLLYLGRTDEAVEVLAGCLRLVRSIGEEPLVAYQTHRLGAALIQAGDYARALGLLDDAEGAYQRLENLSALADCKVSIGRCLEWLDRVDDAVDAMQSASALWDALGEELEYLRAQAHVARLHYAQGLMRDAIRVNQRIVDASQGSDHPDIQAQGAWALLRLADDYLELESWDSVLATLDQDTYWTPDREAAGRLWMASMRARALFALGRPEEALGVADSALAATEDADVNGNTAFLYEIKARVCLAQMRPDRERILAHAIALHLAVGSNDIARELAEYFRPSFSHASSDGFGQFLDQKAPSASGALADRTEPSPSV